MEVERDVFCSLVFETGARLAYRKLLVMDIHIQVVLHYHLASAIGLVPFGSHVFLLE